MGTRDHKHIEKMKKKRALKAAKHAKYLSLAGTSKKAKKQKSKVLYSSILKHAHAEANCGNPGCNKCFPELRRV